MAPTVRHGGGLSPSSLWTISDETGVGERSLRRFVITGNLAWLIRTCSRARLLSPVFVVL